MINRGVYQAENKQRVFLHLQCTKNRKGQAEERCTQTGERICNKVLTKSRVCASSNAGAFEYFAVARLSSVLPRYKSSL